MKKKRKPRKLTDAQAHLMLLKAKVMAMGWWTDIKKEARARNRKGRK